MTDWYKESNGKIRCLICPHNCELAPGKTGICSVRKNNGKKIELLTYGVISGFALDPVEKKPLYHFFPGSDILSIGSYGCNMKCDFCQNHHISQNIPETTDKTTTPVEIIKSALSADNNIGIAFTYNEPVIWYEYMRFIALEARKKGLFTVMVSNGFINSEPLSELATFINAFNIDLKSFNPLVHKQLTGTSIEPVKNSLKQIAKSGNHLEITTLIIPGQNDSVSEIKSLAGWVAQELGKSTPLHLSKYFPMYRRNSPSTPLATMEALYYTAAEILDYVYLGNTRSTEGNNTYCNQCGTLVTTRIGYSTRFFDLADDGKCLKCGNPVYKYFTSPF